MTCIFFSFGMIDMCGNCLEGLVKIRHIDSNGAESDGNVKKGTCNNVSNVENLAEHDGEGNLYII